MASGSGDSAVPVSVGTSVIPTANRSEVMNTSPEQHGGAVASAGGDEARRDLDAAVSGS